MKLFINYFNKTPDINKLLISNMENKFNCSLRVILNPFIEKFAKASLDNLEVLQKKNYLNFLFIIN